MPWILWPKMSHVMSSITRKVADSVLCSIGSSLNEVDPSGGASGGLSGDAGGESLLPSSHQAVLAASKACKAAMVVVRAICRSGLTVSIASLACCMVVTVKAVHLGKIVFV